VTPRDDKATRFSAEAVDRTKARTSAPRDKRFGDTVAQIAARAGQHDGLGDCAALIHLPAHPSTAIASDI